MTLFQELKRRGLIAQCTHEKEIEELLNREKVPFYIGFDATADSLHVGHFLQIIIMKRMQMAGHKPIALLGTGTTMIGDPTGKTDMRKMLTPAEIQHNADCFQRQISHFIDFSDGKAEVVKNGDWLLKMNYIEFLRDVGQYFSVNKMLTAECFKSRLERGLSFLEFNYMLLQSYDFLHLYKEKGVKLELGGDDQWANIISGADLVRRVEGGEAFGMTFTLLATKDGKKMGKTEKGALWLDAEKCSPYDFYQYWINVDDADVINCLKMLTFIDIEELERMERELTGADLNIAKRLLAFTLTEMVHGTDAATKAQNAAKDVFSGTASADMPSTELEIFDKKINILDLLVACKLTPSKREARTLIAGGGIAVSDKKIDDPNEIIEIEDFVIIKKGKKIFHKAISKK